MNIKNLALVGALVAFTALTADAQPRRGGGGYRGYPSYNTGRYYSPNYYSGYRGVPYSYGFNNGYNNFYRGTGVGFGITLGTRAPIYNTPYYSTPYYTTPSFGQTYYYSTPSVVVSPQTTILPTTYTVPTPVATPTESGLRITVLNEGTAKRAGLRAGDIILKVDNQRTQTFESLRDVLATSGKSQVDIEFIDSSNNTLTSRSVGVENTKIGVTVEEVAVDRK